MTRPPISVVMPFAGDGHAAAEALAALTALDTAPGDELIFVDNEGTAGTGPGVTVVRASVERSPAYARNAGAAAAHSEWILFLDADCRAPSNLLDAYFRAPVQDDVGALAGEVVAAASADSLAARYGASRSFLSQAAHLAHPYMPRAVAANLLVRRSAFEQIGGFYEGLRAAEDTDFSWRLQQAGWKLELRADATVEHRYRPTVSELRAQWRGYAAGRAWLRRRYRDFTPQPAASRALGRVISRRKTATAPPPEKSGGHDPRSYLALDALLGFDELAGFMLSNRPARDRPPHPVRVVLLAGRFPAPPGDPLVDYARSLDGARVEASARPQTPWPEASRALDVAYREDDGIAARAGALAWLLLRHPIRSSRDLIGRRLEAPSLFSLAPAAVRLERSRGARVLALGGEDVRATAGRLAALVGRGMERR